MHANQVIWHEENVATIWKTSMSQSGRLYVKELLPEEGLTFFWTLATILKSEEKTCKLAVVKNGGILKLTYQ